jgi:hypothetical protein
LQKRIASQAQLLAKIVEFSFAWKPDQIHARCAVAGKNRRLRSYGATMKKTGNVDRQETGRGLINKAENSHQPFRR